MTSRRFADLHSHPTLYAFNRMRNHPEESQPDRFHPWNLPQSNLSRMARGDRGASYSQCDFAKLQASNTRLVFASITPIERGFFDGSEGGGGHPFAREAIRLATGATLFNAARRAFTEGAQGAADEFTKILRNRGPLRMLTQRIFTNYGLKRLRHLVSADYDYWAEFVNEYNFLKSKDGQVQDVSFESSDRSGSRSHTLSGCYQLIQSSRHLSEMIEGGEDVAAVITIEGAHVFTIAPNQRRVDDAKIFERVDALRNWDHPILFLTLAHHFDNGLCGHAHSIPDAGGFVMDQGQRLQQGFERSSNDLGLRVVRALLGLTDGLKNDGNGRRILIDVKHMSAASRQEYYREVVEPHNASLNPSNSADLAEMIPVIASHAGYSGVATLQELVKSAPRENDNWHLPPFYAWNLNFCDDDIRQIHRSGGLFGVCFDQRIAGMNPGRQLDPDLQPRLLHNQIFGVVDVIMLDDRLSDAEKIRVWDCVCIGSDFDGLIDPVSVYPTTLAFSDFADDLAAALKAVSHTRMLSQIGVETVVEKICWRNAYEFALRHLP